MFARTQSIQIESKQFQINSFQSFSSRRRYTHVNTILSVDVSLLEAQAHLMDFSSSNPQMNALLLKEPKTVKQSTTKFNANPRNLKSFALFPLFSGCALWPSIEDVVKVF